jgi:hypothetical protein
VAILRGKDRRRSQEALMMDEQPGTTPLPPPPRLVKDDPDPLIPFAFTADGPVRPTPDELAAVVAPTPPAPGADDDPARADAVETPDDSAHGDSAPHRAALGGDWAFGKQGGGPSVRVPIRTPLALALIVLVLGAVGAYWFLNRPAKSGGSGSGTAFALSLTKGSSYRYSTEVSATGTITVGGQQQPFSMNVTETMGWAVESVDADGTATVTVSIDGLSGTVDGVPAQTTGLPPATIKITKDGQMLSAVGFAPELDSGFGNSLPGSDQFLPALPDHPVEPGDTWTTSYDQDVPYASGALHYEASNTLLRYEDIDGVRAAVIQTHLQLPLNITFKLSEMAKAFGGSADEVPSGAKMVFRGEVTMDQTSWFDPAAGELVKTSMRGNFDMRIAFKGIPQSELPGGDEVSFVGTMSVKVDRLSGAPGTPVAKEHTKKHQHKNKKKSG